MAASEEEQVVLVNDRDEALGVLGKMEAHRQGALHRAFSVFLFDGEARLLMQRRALGKYHSGGLWTNTCCSHPRPGEDVRSAAQRRCQEELGVTCALQERFAFLYRAALADGLIEHEYDHVFFGHLSTAPAPDPEEVMDTAWVTREELQAGLRDAPERYTSWLLRCWPQVLDHWPAP